MDEDVADLDGLDDATEAKASRSLTQVVDLASSGRLRLRAPVPVAEGYEGKAVSRKKLYQESEGEDLDENYELLKERLGSEEGGFSIAEDVEEEYEKLMRSTKEEIAVMRQPSAEDVAQKQQDAQQLKRHMETWAALIQTRIHLEGALSIGHRMPCGLAAGLFREHAGVAEETKAVAGDVEKVLAELLFLQERMMQSHCSFANFEASKAAVLEGHTWKILDERLQTVLDWALTVADTWKESTRLDARRSFKVLDQSLRLQMQAVAEAEPEKLRQRCTPAAGKHEIFGEGSEKEIFDDRDFYVQLLKEVLSAPNQDAEDRQLLAEVQGRRASKRKAQAEVERRASKGRKIRYRAIEKLQNFMAARPRQDEDPLSETACQALLSSLFAPPKA